MLNRVSTSLTWQGRRILLSATAMVLTTALAAFGFEIVRDRKAKCVIVVPDQTPTNGWETYVANDAAQELQYHVKQSTGVKLEITAESKKPAKSSGGLSPTLNYLYMGTCNAAKEAGITTTNLPRNSCVIKTMGDDMFICGRDLAPPYAETGTRMGVYNLLDRQMGVRWLWPGKLGEVIPRKNTIAIGKLNQTFIPPLRSYRPSPGPQAILAGWSGEPARKQFADDENLWNRRHGENWDLTTRAQHAPAVYKYWDRFQKTHPEFLNQLPDGTRRPDPYHCDGGYIGMCVAEPGLWRQVVEDWKTNRLTNPRASVEASENDINGCCVCPKCLSWDVRDPKLGKDWDNRLENATRAFNAKDQFWSSKLGSVSDRYARFYMEVQNVARQTDPEAIVTGYAYANYVDGPRKTKLNSNIILSYVGDIMFPWTPEPIKYFKKTWKGWSDAGARMVWRPNCMLSGHNMPIFFARKFNDLFRFCYKNGLIGDEFDSNTGQYSTQGPDLYMMARMEQAPNMSFDEIMDEYYSAFGPAKAVVKEYFALWEKVSDSQETIDAYKKVEEKIKTDPMWAKWTNAGGWNYFFMAAPFIFSGETMARGEAILDKTAAKAKDDPTAAARVEFLRKGLKNAELTLQAQLAFNSGDKYELVKAVDKLDAYRATLETDSIANLGFLTQLENGVWDRTSLKFMSAPPGVPLPDTWKFMWDPEEKGTGSNWFAPQFDDSQWYKIGIDTPWEEQPVGKDWKKQKNLDYNGIGWYRNSFQVKQPAQGKKMTKAVLTFGAVDEACEVWINGKHVLSRPYPYKGNGESWREPFEVNITDAILFDRPNILAVRVEDRAGAGGIFRPVWIAVVEASVSATNLLSNGGFEEKDKDWSQSNMTGNNRFICDESQAHSGRYSGLLDCTGIVPNGVNVCRTAWARWYRFQNVEPGKKYTFRVWVRTEPSYQGAVNVSVIGTDPDANDVNRSFSAGSTNGLWKEVVFAGIAGPRCGQVGIYLNSLGALGKVWFDDAELMMS